MKRLLWKEWRERAMLMVLWALAVIILAVLGKGQRIYEFAQSFSIWSLIPVAFALFAGLGAYGSELKAGRATFLYSRALLWKQTLIAKIIPGLVVALVAPLLGALACRLIIPMPYLAFLTPANLLHGALGMSMLTGCAYLIGIGCSVVLPGLAGGMVILLSCAGVFFIIGFTLDRILLDPASPFAMIIGGLAAPFIAAVVIARFGITLSPGARTWRFFLVLFIPILLGAALDFSPLIQQVQFVLQGDGVNNMTISPSGAYAAVMVPHESTIRNYWVCLGSDRSVRLPDGFSVFNGWTANDCMLVIQDGANESQETVAVKRWEHGKIRTYDLGVVLDNIGDMQFLPSPNEQKLLISSRRYGIRILDLHTGKIRLVAKTYTQRQDGNTLDTYRRCWWQSNEVVGYIEPGSERRVLVPVGGG